MLKSPRVAFHTLGCKLNQAESTALAGEFYSKGYRIVPFGDEADICIINSCTVTERADAKCRQAIRKAHKLSPNAVIAVVGCYAQMQPDELLSFPGVRVILGSDRKYEILDRIEDYFKTGRTQVGTGTNREFVRAHPGAYHDLTRAFLKIQDGCNNFCSYCIVPYARGRSRSEPLSSVITDVHKLIEAGYREIVLTGVHIGRYGHDLPSSTTLIELLKLLSAEFTTIRIRLSSLEPMEIDDVLIDLIADSNKICPHFHVPLQSGDNSILRSMNRIYTSEHFFGIVDMIKRKIPHAAIGTDVIAGFPGETEEAFRNTYDLIRDLPLSYLHVFVYSKRTGTRAAEFKQQVSRLTKKQRSDSLIELGKEKKREFYRQSLGTVLNVLFESRSYGDTMSGFSENYIKVGARKDVRYFNQITPVKIIAADAQAVKGTILSLSNC